MLTVVYPIFPGEVQPSLQVSNASIASPCNQAQTSNLHRGNY